MKWVLSVLPFFVMSSIGSSASENLLSLFSAPVQLTILANFEHDTFSVNQATIQSLKALRQSRRGLDCVFLEYPEVASPAVERFMRSEATYSDSVGAYEQDVRNHGVGIILNLAPEVVLSAARKMKLKVFPVDIDFDTERGRRLKKIHQDANSSEVTLKLYVQEYTEARSKFMADGIHRAFSSGKCRTGALIIGSGHVIHKSDNLPVVPIQKMLASKKIESGIYQMAPRHFCGRFISAQSEVCRHEPNFAATSSATPAFMYDWYPPYAGTVVGP